MMIDLQGALLAPPEYDLVCLLRDSYVELREAEITQQLERVRPQLPDAPEEDEFMHRFDLLTLSRKAKDHARFVFAAKHRGEIRLRDHLPVTVRHLRGAAMRVAMRESRFSALAELIHTLPEPTCAG
jgi:aminoglycoside/choline kinase family phosphotransferase